MTEARNKAVDDAAVGKDPILVAYEEMFENGKTVSELPGWLWEALVDECYRAWALDSLRDVNVVAMSPGYWNRAYYVYREVEAYASGFGRCDWFDIDFFFMYTV